MKPNVILYKEIPDDQLVRLQSHFNLTYFDGINDANRPDFIRALKEADGIIGASYPITTDYLDVAQKLKLLPQFQSVLINSRFQK